MGRIRVLGRAAALAVLAAAVVGFAATPARAATVAFERQSTWNGGYVGAFTVTNDTAAPLTWRVEFDLPAGTAVATSWSGRFTRTGEHYAVVGESWNATLAAGAATTFGFVAQGDGDPQNYRPGGTPDLRPPTAPGNLRTVLAPTTMTLRWDASADNVAVTAYEVYLGASLAATVTGTEYTMPTPPPAIFTYRVRALDAAGNASPFAVITPGGPPDTVAPGAPTQLRFGSGAQGTTLGWTAATDNVAVAGYHVYVNGEHYGPTSSTGLTVPRLGFGTFAFRVVAFDGAGLQSPALAVAVAIDPGPASDARQPTVPANLRFALSATAVTWSWDASTDNVGVAGYQVFKDADWIADVPGTTWTEPRAPGRTTFSLRVRAFDATGNKSAFASLAVVVDPLPGS
ncbi:cellulose binding domain-containing protein [Dactylosporangium sp. NPDC005572]|uniref:cellulose binding domain-containing protein n=1 Tax=Dactylosporangium sp. NPDC005572 TaxID=3156889 RepID=UPI0033ADD900